MPEWNKTGERIVEVGEAELDEWYTWESEEIKLMEDVDDEEPVGYIDGFTVSYDECSYYDKHTVEPQKVEMTFNTQSVPDEGEPSFIEEDTLLVLGGE